MGGNFQQMLRTLTRWGLNRGTIWKLKIWAGAQGACSICVPGRRLGRGAQTEESKNKDDHEVDDGAKVENVADEDAEANYKTDPYETAGETEPSEWAVGWTRNAEKIHGSEKKHGEGSGKSPEQSHVIVAVSLVRAQAVANPTKKHYAAKDTVEHFHPGYPSLNLREDSITRWRRCQGGLAGGFADCERAYLFDDGGVVDFVFGEKFGGCAAVGNFADGKAYDLDAVRGDSFRNSIADAPGGPVILDGDDGVVGLAGRLDEGFGIDGPDAENVDDANGDTLLLEFVEGFQSFIERDATGDDGDQVAVAAAKDFGFADLERLVVFVEDRLLGAAGANIG